MEKITVNFDKVKGVGKDSGEKITSFRPKQSASKLKKRMTMSSEEIELFKDLVQENKSAKDKKAEKEAEKSHDGDAGEKVNEEKKENKRNKAYALFLFIFYSVFF